MVSEYLKFAPDIKTPQDAVAARRLYSTLAQFEQIAVMAAERGDGVVNQLAEELAHRDTFEALAMRLGGIEPPAPETRALVEKLTALRGPASNVLLNLVAETWLGCVFDWLSSPGWGDKLFRRIESDEARHIEEAWLLDLPENRLIEKYLPAIERALVAIAMSPGFLVPIIHLRGYDVLWQIGMDAVARHSSVCARLGMRPGPATRELMALCWRLKRFKKPQPVRVPDSRLTLMRASCNNLPMHTTIRVPYKGKRNLAIAWSVAAVNSILVSQPQFCVVGRSASMWRVDPTVAVRVALTDRDGLPAIGTIGLQIGELSSPKDIIREIQEKRHRLRRRKYLPPPDVASMISILPPATASVVITDVSAHGFYNGSIPLADCEGIPIIVGIGDVSDGYITYLLTMDHRFYDPADLAQFCDSLYTNILAYVNKT